MNKRNRKQISVMKRMKCIQIVDGRTVPGKSFQQIAIIFSQVYSPEKTVNQLVKEIRGHKR